ncbi:ArsC family reductase [Rhodoferax ferrireducens]|uniref:ArsC family reductase n=1 Tax=Rhodoferax ferrireducens TaxID=192843 RepID=UPI000E0DA1B4|nr:ArsC family reductase [Rhodoferax ferrireducens]
MRAMNTLANPAPLATAPTVSLYGIPNCDTVKKARSWLTEQRVDYAFHDFKKLSVPADQLPNWLAAVGWEKLINRKGNTWRGLDDATRAAVVDAATASALMLANPSVIKRPVVVWADGRVTVGFDATEWLGSMP